MLFSASHWPVEVFATPDLDIWSAGVFGFARTKGPDLWSNPWKAGVSNLGNIGWTKNEAESENLIVLAVPSPFSPRMRLFRKWAKP